MKLFILVYILIIICCLKNQLNAPHIPVIGLQKNFKISDGQKARGDFRCMN